MTPAATSSVAQITTSGRSVQAKNGPITIKNVLPGAIGNTTDSTRLGRIRGAYLHVPFCFHKCHYCDFYSIVDSRDRQAQFTDRLIAEVQAASEFIDQPVET